MPSWSFPPTLASAFAPRLPPLAPLAGWRALGGIVLALALPGLLLMLAGRYPHRVVDPLLLTSAGTTLVSLSYIALVRTTEWRRVLELGVRPFPREFGIGLALGLLACATIAACDVALDAVAGIVMQDAATPDGRAIASAFVSSRQFALIEEIAFRGLLMRWLLGVTREGRAIAIQAAGRTSSSRPRWARHSAGRSCGGARYGRRSPYISRGTCSRSFRAWPARPRPSCPRGWVRLNMAS